MVREKCALGILVNYLGRGKKEPANYPHFVDKGGSPHIWISIGGGRGRRMWITKFLNVNIINLEKVDKPKGGGGGGKCGEDYFVNDRLTTKTITCVYIL